MSRPLTFAILGDSAATGVGDYDSFGRPRGWCFHLASAFAGPVNLLQVARSGAQSNEVLHEQLPKALAYKPDLAALVVGGNDLLRNGFNPEKLQSNLRHTIEAFREQGSEVLMLQLHDPTRNLRLPKTLAKVLRRRVDAVNAVYFELAEEFNLLLLRTRELPGIYARHLWHFDRMHPSSHGHLKIAKHFRDLLEERGWRLNALQTPEVPTPSSKDNLIWMLRNGTPWFIKRSFDLLPAALLLVAWEYIRPIIQSSQLVTRKISGTKTIGRS